MEIRRLIDKELINKIFEDYKHENESEINKFFDIIHDAEDSLKLGQQLLNKRYEFFCFKYADRVQQYGKYNEKSINYSQSKYFTDDLDRCLNFAEPTFLKDFETVKKKIAGIKEFENKIAVKCMVLEHNEIDIKNCLSIKYDKFKHNMLKDLKNYYESLENFKQNVYL
jgi:hypothetical protein